MKTIKQVTILIGEGVEGGQNSWTSTMTTTTTCSHAWSSYVNDSI